MAGGGIGAEPDALGFDITQHQQDGVAVGGLGVDGLGVLHLCLPCRRVPGSAMRVLHADHASVKTESLIVLFNPGWRPG
jgi:hypothetical protein